MRTIGIILLAVILFVYIDIMISSQNPCSSFSATPSLCNSDNIENY